MAWKQSLAAIGEKWLQRLPSLDARWRKPALFLLLVIIMTAFLAFTVIPPRIETKLDHPAPQAFKAPFDMVDRPATDRLRREAAERIPDLYEPDPEVNEAVRSQLAEDFAALHALRGQEEVSLAQLVAQAEDRLGIEFPEEVIQAVLQAPPRNWELLEKAALEVAHDFLEPGIRGEELASVRRQVPDAVRLYEYDRPSTAFLSLLLQNRLQANLVLNEEATLMARQQAEAGVEERIIRRGEVIVYEGQRITEDDLIRLRDAGLLREEIAYPGFFGAFLLALVLVGLMAAYLKVFHPNAAWRESHLLLISLIIIVTLVGGRVVWLISGYAMPVAAGAMLLAILINPRVASFATALMAVTLGMVTGGHLEYSLVTLTGGLVGIFSVTHVGQRADFMRAGLYAGLGKSAVIIAWPLIHGVALAELTLWQDVLWGLGGGIMAAILTIGSLPLLETVFGILTPVRLLELANPDQPLLRRLLVEAPGTYHHSIMVANLAEAATERVGGNSLLARVGSYYHDVGKLRRPYFFVENQFGGENPHDKINPNLSGLIITAHVKDGIELAKEYKLPRELIRFIEEHHGTMRVGYFYNQALKAAGGEEILEENFVYPGPVPQSRETAICMLADAAEATVRSLPKPTPGRIESAVRQLVRDRLNQGQLDRCDLTLKDLNLIADTFIEVLNGIFHARIEYPEPVLPAGKGAVADASAK